MGNAIYADHFDMRTNRTANISLIHEEEIRVGCITLAEKRVPIPDVARRAHQPGTVVGLSIGR